MVDQKADSFHHGAINKCYEVSLGCLYSRILSSYKKNKIMPFATTWIQLEILLLNEGKLVADAAKSLGLKHVVYSGLENVWRLTGGKLEVPHFDGKGEVEEYFWSIGVPMTSVRIAAYFENFLGPWKPVKASDGDYYTLALPMGDVPMYGISVADVGVAVCSIFNSPEEFIGKAVGLSAEALTIQQYADILSKSMGKEVRDAKITPEAYEKLGVPAVKEVANMCRFYQMKPDRDIELTRRLNPKVKSFSQFVSENQAALKVN